MTEAHWRTEARLIIQKVLADNKGKSKQEVEKALHEAYPFGQRNHYPYKVWLEECKAYLRRAFPKTGEEQFEQLPLFSAPKQQE